MKNFMKDKMMKGLMKLTVMLALFAFATAGAASATVYFSINAGASGDPMIITEQGGVAFDTNGTTRLPVGTLVQYIRVGADGVANAPDPTQANYVSANDILLAEKTVGSDTVWLTFSNEPGLFFHSVSGSYDGSDTSLAKIYIRVWNSDTIASATHYIDSALLTPNTNTFVQPSPNDVGTGNLVCSNGKPTINQAPNDPTGLNQYKADGITAIPAGAWLNNSDINTVVFKFTVSDPDGGTVFPQVQYRPYGAGSWTTETGPVVASGSTGTVTVTGLVSDTQYEWQARVFDGAQYSSWVDFNGSAAADFGIDISAPAVTYTLPDNAATGISKGLTSILITFNDDMDPSTVGNTANYSVQGALSGAHSVTSAIYSPAPRNVTLTVTGDFAISEGVNCSVATGVKDKAGNNMAAAYNWSFDIERPVITNIIWREDNPDNIKNKNYVYGTIEIQGSNFGSDPGNGSRDTDQNKVTIGAVKVPDLNPDSGIEVYYWDETTIVAGVPLSDETATNFTVAADNNVVVTVNGGASNSDKTILVRPKIYSVAPTSGVIGSPVSITGTAFGAIPANVNVSFNGGNIVASTANNTAMTVTVPGSATTGPLSVTVNGKVSNANYDWAPYDPITFTVETVTVISNAGIARAGDSIGSGVTLTWQVTPVNAGVDIYTRTGDFSGSAAGWTKAAGNVTISMYTDAAQVGNGTAKFYKLIPAGATLQDSDLTSEVFGKFDLNIKEGSNFVSLPLIPNNTNINSVIGNQLYSGTPLTSDRINYYDAVSTSYLTAYLGGTGWSGSLASMEADKGYFITRQAGQGTREVTVVGSMFLGNSRNIDIYQGSNMVGTAYPASVNLNASGLSSVLTSGLPTAADKVYYYDNPTQTWLSAYLGAGGFAGSLSSFEPGKGYYVNNQALIAPPDADVWNYTK